MKKTLVLLVLSGIGYVETAHAVCSEPQPRSICAEYSASTVVAEATLQKIENVLFQNDPNTVLARYYTLKADRAFRGTPDQTIKIYEENDSGRASFAWKIGTRYLLFLFNARQQSDQKLYSIDGCGNSGPSSRESSALREIAQTKDERQFALISGTVSVYNLSGPVQGVEVVAHSSGETYKATMDRKGRFAMKVAPGDYIVRPRSLNSSFEVFEMSYDDPRHLSLKAGTCAQVQFIETSNR